MDARTLEALKGSIAKWEAIVAGTGEDHGPSNCPLCAKFWRSGCVGCPAATAAQDAYCRGTPYEAWARYWDWRETKEKTGDTAKAKRLAQAELDFLRSLLPAEAA